MVLPQTARNNRDQEAMKRAISEYDEALEAYIPGQWRIPWACSAGLPAIPGTL